MMKRKHILLCILAGSLLLLSPAICSAEQTYRITEQELTTLESRFQIVKTNNTLLLNKLEKLNSKLMTLEVLSQTQETQLKTLNKSFEAYAKEEKAKQRRLKWQRNTAWTVCVGTIIFAISKK